MVIETGCPAVQQLEMAFLGRLSDSDTAEIEQHLFGCEACAQATVNLAADGTLLAMLRQSANGGSSVSTDAEDSAVLSPRMIQLIQKLRDLPARALALNAQLKAWREAANANTVRWVEVYSHAVQLNTTPLSIAETFKTQLEAPRTWIFTSATLAVKGDFRHYQEEMGLSDAKTAYWDSPFDYANQALLYVPQHLPEPNTPDYTRAVVEAALPVLQASGGRAFLLFTSLRAMREAHGLLQAAFETAKLDFPLLLQGEGSRTELLERFRRLGNAVLVASHSFWEGVDVRGSALSLVIIDRLPFAVPDDPVLSARIEKMNNEGRNAFMEYQLPQAVITLKQGAGRLIRDETDRGVLMICDPRLLSKPYGKRIWQSLPPMRRTRELVEVEQFFDTLTSVQTHALG